MRYVLILILIVPQLFASDIPIMTDKIYKENCTECHFGYQAGLLNGVSWEKLMQAEELEEHFGSDASIEEEDRLYLIDFLKKNSAETLWNKKSRKIAYSMDHKVFLRVSKIPYIVKKHEKVKKEYFTSDKVKSQSHCNKCHERASKGVFEEDDVLIPGYGRWHDD